MAEMKMVVGVEGLDEIRALTAALEQYNANSRGDAAQINRLEAHLTEARDKLTRLERATDRAVAILNDDPCVAPLPGEPLSVIEEAALSAKGAARRADEIGRVQRELSEARTELDKVRKRLNREQNETAWAAGFLMRDPVPPRLPGAPISLIESVAIKVREHADRLQAIQMLQGKRTATLSTNEVGAMLLREVSAVMRALEQSRNHRDDECRQVREALGVGELVPVGDVTRAIDALQVDRSMQAHTADVLRGRVNDLQEQIAKAAPVESDKKLADALKMRLAEANDTITKQAEVIKELHKQYHELEASKKGVQYDLDQAKEEIAFAEAEAAKYKPLIEAVRETGSRGGALFIAAGHWVELDGWTTTATGGKQPSRVGLSGNYLLGALKCL